MDGAMDATMMAPWCFDFYNRSELRHRRDWTCPGAALAPSSLIIAPLARSCARRDTDHTHAAGIGAERYQPWAPVHRHLCTPRIDQEGLRPEVDACPRPRKRPEAASSRSPQAVVRDASPLREYIYIYILLLYDTDDPVKQALSLEDVAIPASDCFRELGYAKCFRHLRHVTSESEDAPQHLLL